MALVALLPASVQLKLPATSDAVALVMTMEPDRPDSAFCGENAVFFGTVGYALLASLGLEGGVVLGIAHRAVVRVTG